MTLPSLVLSVQLTCFASNKSFFVAGASVKMPLLLCAISAPVVRLKMAKRFKQESMGSTCNGSSSIIINPSFGDLLNWAIQPLHSFPIESDQQLE